MTLVTILRGFFAVVLAAGVVSCSGAGSYDPAAGLEREDYERLAQRRAQPEAPPPQAEPPIPEMRPLLAAPAPPDPAASRLVSISVTEETPLKDVLIELARKARLDLELDPSITGGIVFMAHERPIEEVVRRIADLAGLRYRFEDGVLRVEVDRMYHRSYRLDYMNMVRTASSSVSTSTDVFSAVGEGGGGGGGGGAGNGSNSQIQMESESDFWAELSANIEQILTNARPRRLMATARATRPTQPRPAAQTPTEPNADGADGAAQLVDEDNADGADGAAQLVDEPNADGADGAAQLVDEDAAAAVEAPASATQSIGTEEDAPAATPAAAADDAEEDELAEQPESWFSINKQAGIVSVYGTDKQHRAVREYLEEVTATLGAQVLIEAKVLEVRLNEEFKSGINWRSLGTAGLEFALPLGNAFGNLPTTQPPFTTPGTAPSDTLTLAYTSGDLAGLVSLIEDFGTVRTLSSPRLTVMNNQTAVLKVAENEVYFRLEIETTTTDGVSTTTVESELNTVPIGVVMTVQPTIDFDDEEVILSLRPTVSRITRWVVDPAVAFQQVSGVTSLVPVVEVREMDSVVRIPSGQVVVMGGLMQERLYKESQGVPGASRVPVLGELFKARDDEGGMTELVIFLRATIVKASETIDPADKDLYRRFSSDPRPLAF